jgi:predicted alpha/beta-fold hydrolase
MTLNPGTNDTTWQPTWNNGKTRTIRVPVSLAEDILDYARALDQQNFTTIYRQVILQALNQYVEYKRQNYHPNQYSREVNTNTRAWDEFRKFMALIETEAQLEQLFSSPLPHYPNPESQLTKIKSSK